MSYRLLIAGFDFGYFYDAPESNPDEYLNHALKLSVYSGDLLLLHLKIGKRWMTEKSGYERRMML